MLTVLDVVVRIQTTRMEEEKQISERMILEGIVEERVEQKQKKLVEEMETAVKRRVEEALREIEEESKKKKETKEEKEGRGDDGFVPDCLCRAGGSFGVHEDVAGCSGDDAEQNRERERDGGHVLGADEERRGRGGNHVAFERVYARGL